MASVLKVRPRSAKEIENIASEVIRGFQPEALRKLSSFEVEDFFEFELKDKTDVEPDTKDYPDGIDGCTDFEEMKCYISRSLMEYGDCEVTRRRLRATQAHEIGHCFLHVEDARRSRKFQQKFLNDSQSSLEIYNPDDLKAYENPEWQAWRFASALLMPEHCIKRALECNWKERWIKDTFDVNPAFIYVRLRELKISRPLRKG
jgi:Zn-dependent peptidase ImmA (M78 family)